MERKDILDNLSAKEAIAILAEDLKKFAEWEYANQPKVPGTDAYFRHRRNSLLFAASYLEKSL
jgi:hypothetical protein